MAAGELLLLALSAAGRWTPAVMLAMGRLDLGRRRVRMRARGRGLAVAHELGEQALGIWEAKARTKKEVP